MLALTGTTASFGTPYYMPPEQVRGARQVDQRSDVYALGVVLYECVCGRRPFESDSIYTILHAIGAGEYPAPRAVRPDLPVGIEAAIVRAMRLEPDGRFPSARHFAAALLPFASETARLVWADTFRIAGPAAPSATPPPGGKPTSAGSQPPATFSNTTLGNATGQRIDGEPPPAGKRRRPLLVGAGLAAAAVIAAAVGLTRLRPPAPASSSLAFTAPVAVTAPAPPPRPAEPTTFRVDVEADPTGAVLELDGVAAGTGRLHRELARDGHVHRLTARFPGYESTAVEFVDRSPAPRLTLTPAPPPAAPGAPAQAEKTTERHASPTRRSKSASRSPAAPSAPASPALPRAPAPTKSANNAPVLD